MGHDLAVCFKLFFVGGLCQDSWRVPGACVEGEIKIHIAPLLPALRAVTNTPAAFLDSAVALAEPAKMSGILTSIRVLIIHKSTAQLLHQILFFPACRGTTLLLTLIVPIL